MKHESGNSQLLNDYRVARINAYSLGDEIKDLYSIVPPKVILGKLDRIIEEFGRARKQKQRRVGMPGCSGLLWKTTTKR